MAQRVLFVCVHNSGRSQMAEAFARRLSNGKLIAESAGTAPTESLNKVVVEAMRERGIDITSQRPKLLSLGMPKRADRIFTMGCYDEGQCPAMLLDSEDWALDDPHGQPIEKVRAIRDEVERRVQALVEEAREAASGS